MLCSKPFKRGVLEFGCGQCLPCRINRRRIWVSRILLEFLTSPGSAFVTLTYSDGSLPEPPYVARSVLQGYLKRLRKHLEPVKIRYFGVGEYGENYGRPHYHLCVFGFAGCGRYGQGFACHCTCEFKAAWSDGFVAVGSVTPASARYVAGYVLEKSGDRAAVFASMSRRGGIGLAALSAFAEGLVTDGGARALTNLRDVPGEFRVDGKKHRIGRYLRGKLREAVGWDAENPRKAEMLLERILEYGQEGFREQLEARRAQDVFRAKQLMERK